MPPRCVNAPLWLSLCATFLAWPVVAEVEPPVAEVAPGPPDPWVAAGDRAWARRAEGAEGSVADPGPIREAVDAYQVALEAEPRDLERRWKLLRALFFLGDYTDLEAPAKLSLYEQGREAGERGLDQLAVRLGGRDAMAELEPRQIAAVLGDEIDATPIFFWTTVHWGLWGETHGKFAAARAGVGGRVRRYAEIVVALDETFQNATGHRVLGRLNSEAPRIPFFTSWVNRDVAAEHLERAIQLAPEDLGNRLFLAQCLIEHHKQRRDEAIGLLEGLVDAEPSGDFLIEDLRIIEDARALLAALAK